MKATYRDIPRLLEARQEFDVNSVKAFWNVNTNNYEVYSYNTRIFLQSRGRVLTEFNNKYYSVTTSKLQNMLIDVFKLNDGKRTRD